MQTTAQRVSRAPRRVPPRAPVVAAAAAFPLLGLLLPALPSLQSGRFGDEAVRGSALAAGGLAVAALVTFLTSRSGRRVNRDAALDALVVALGACAVGHAWLWRSGVTVAFAVVDVTFTVAWALIGLAALQPALPAGRPAAVRSWTASHLLLFVPALVLPGALLAVTVPGTGAVELAVLGGTTVLAPGLLLVRARGALRAARHAQAHDALTGLPTRELFLHRLGEMIGARGAGGGGPVAVAVVDLDTHPQIVHSWGHEAGDAAVALVARRVVDVLPPGSLVARLGGDGFAAVLRGGPAEMTRQADALRLALDGPLDLGDLTLVATASVGLATVTGMPDQRSLLTEAVTAMNEAHRRGGNRVCRFEQRLRTTTERRAAVERALRDAVRRGEVRLVYQPVVDLPTGRLIGAEALLRWTSPELGDVDPEEFVPIAEDTGLVELLGTWAVEEACRRLVQWEQDGVVSPDFTMAINVSTRQLRSHRLSVLLRDLLETTGVAADRIVLEITESALPDDLEGFVEVLERLRALGVQLAVDDFGTGYASLSYLRCLPITAVKLDRSLVEQVVEEPHDAIPRAVQGIATALGLVVIAEGVQTREQREVLLGMGIAHGQGWLWGRPVAPDEFPPPGTEAAATPSDPPDQSSSTTTGA